jgi:DNA replication protein DnaC
MRTKQNWEQNWEKKAIEKYFTPRITKDLLTLNFPQLPDEQPNSTFICGKIKTGKTIHAACLALQQVKYDYLNELPVNLLFVSFPEMLAEIKDTYNNKGKTESEVMKKYLDVPFLVIDDFLTTRPTDWVMDVLYYLINHRYEYLLTTVITSNYTLEELEELLNDQRITSRIDRMCEVVEKTGFKNAV